MLLSFRMKNIFKPFLFSLVALFGAAQIIEGFSFGNDIAVLIFAAIVFGIANSILKPILKLITLPFNLITFGSFSFLINTVLLYLTIRVVPGLLIEAFRFPGMEISLPSQYPDLVIHPFDIPTIGTLLLTSIVISLFTVVLGIIFDQK